MSHELLEIADDSSKDFIITEAIAEVIRRQDSGRWASGIEADVLSAKEFAERTRQEIRESFCEWKPSEDKESSMWPLLDEPASEKRSALAQDADHGEPSPEANHSASSPRANFRERARSRRSRRLPVYRHVRRSR
jgi:hypothetical protein